jgi:hypothetical protein
MRHSRSTAISVFALLVVAAATISLIGSRAGAAVPAGPCVVRNTTSNTWSAGKGDKLQAAISHAAPGSTLIVRGRCVGLFHFDKALTIIGRPTADVPYATLDGDGLGVVLTLRGEGRVELRDLKITDGRGASRGSGIRNRARLILSGHTRVTDNRGIGVWTRGLLKLRDHAVVSRNSAPGPVNVSGGIYNARGVTKLLDSSVVRDNVAWNGGGLFIFNGHLLMRGSAAVTRNLAKNIGGGVLSEARITLRGSARVTGNKARTASGGIYNAGRAVRVCSTSVRLSPNDPDDPPKTKACA